VGLSGTHLRGLLTGAAVEEVYCTFRGEKLFCFLGGGARIDMEFELGRIRTHASRMGIQITESSWGEDGTYIASFTTGRKIIPNTLTIVERGEHFRNGYFWWENNKCPSMLPTKL
jgi:hypothetical protein